jgi:hypothetical protein
VALGRGDVGAPLRLDLNPWDLLIIFGLGLGVWSLYTLRLKDRPPGLSLLGFVFVCGLIGVLVAAPIAAASAACRSRGCGISPASSTSWCCRRSRRCGCSASAWSA